MTAPPPSELVARDEPAAPGRPPASERMFADVAALGLAYYFLSGGVVLLGLLFGTEFVVQRGTKTPTRGDRDLVVACVRFDGWHYRSIAHGGYDYDPSERSTVAFFPAYPLLARALSGTTGLRTEESLVLTSNAFLAAAFALLAWYTHVRVDVRQPHEEDWTLLAFGLWPSTFFFRMALAESLFVTAALLTLIGIRRRWPLVPLAVIAGLATATRPVGVAVAAAYLWHVLFDRRGPFGARLGRAAILAPVACWGLLAYMAYQGATFGTPFAFAQTQEHWTNQIPVDRPTAAEKAWALATLEPIRGVFDPDSPRYWDRPDGTHDFVFSIFFWNPVLFAAAAALVTYGAWRRWLTGPEVVLGATLLAIPYLTRGYEMSMASHARFAAAVVVIYPVLGRLLASWPVGAAVTAVSAFGLVLMCWTALYTSGYLLF